MRFVIALSIRLSLFFSVALALSSASSTSALAAQSPDAEQLLQQAEKLYDAMEYEAALKLFIAVHKASGVTPMQRARSYLYMGAAFTALGNAENAVQSFMMFLKLQPTFRLPPGISPSIQAMYKEALRRLKLPETAPAKGGGGGGGGGGEEKVRGPEAKRDASVSLSEKGPSKIIAGQPIDIRIEISDPKELVEDVVIQWRVVGGPDYSTVRVKHTPGKKAALGRIPGATVGSKAGRLHYIVEAVGKGGETLAHAGTYTTPVEVILLAPPHVGSKWGWYTLGIGGGLAVAGGVVAAILLTRKKEPTSNNMADISIRIK